MICRHRFIENREGFTGYKRKGNVYLEPPAPPKFKPMAHPELLRDGATIRRVAECNWLRRLLYIFNAPRWMRRSV
jgi:hypothetical protein